VVRAVRLVETGRPLEAAQVESPRPGPEDITVRIEAAGICRSDMHYRSGHPTTGVLPITLGHEIAGAVEARGGGVAGLEVGDRVAVHYLITCGACRWCLSGSEQFCPEAQMIGKDRDGGYAETVVIPARNAHRVPDTVPIEHAAVMMCSTATSLHALRKGRFAPGSQVAVFGAGGLGISAIQLGMALGAAAVYAVDIDDAKLDAVATLGAVPIDGRGGTAATEIVTASGGGVDIALELVGSARLLRDCLEATSAMGRVVSVGLTEELVELSPYRDFIVSEKELIGCSDHLGSEIPELMEMAARGDIDLGRAITRVVPLEAAAVNGVLDDLERFDAGIRTVIRP
jgi:propanol-preferring alcohol dehydrogenase